MATAALGRANDERDFLVFEKMDVVEFESGTDDDWTEAEGMVFFPPFGDSNNH